MKKKIFILMLGIVGSCKDKCPDPDTSGSNNGGNNSNEYVLKGKFLDGTTMTAKYPGMVLTAVLSKTDVLGTETEELGQTKMDNGGNFEFTYKHSKLAENSLTKLTLRSNFYISPLLPKNRNVDTVIYESTKGRVDILVDGLNMIDGDTLYFAYWNKEFNTGGDKHAIIDTILTPLSGLYKSLIVEMPTKNFWWGRNSSEFASGLGKNRASIQLIGDPYIDTLTVEY